MFPHPALSIPHADLMQLARSVLSEGEGLRFQVTGCSMLPFIPPNARIYVRQGSPQWGDAILYQVPEGRLIVHRVVGKAGSFQRSGSIRRFRVRGDRLWAPLEWVSPEQVLGVVIRVQDRDCNRLTYRLPIWLWISIRPFLRLLRAGLARCRHGIGKR